MIFISLLHSSKILTQREIISDVATRQPKRYAEKEQNKVTEQCELSWLSSEKVQSCCFFNSSYEIRKQMQIGNQKETEWELVILVIWSFWTSQKSGGEERRKMRENLYIHSWPLCKCERAMVRKQSPCSPKALLDANAHEMAVLPLFTTQQDLTGGNQQPFPARQDSGSWLC